MSPDPTVKINTETLTVPCSIVDKAMITQLATDTGQSMSHVVRDLIKWRHQMRFSNNPTCANGHKCLCSSMHAVQEANAMSDQDRVENVHMRMNPGVYQEPV